MPTESVDELEQALQALMVLYTPVGKAYPHEHAARQHDPSGYTAIRRQNDKFGPGISALFGVKADGKTEVQSIRFDASKFTPEEAKKWLKDHQYSTGSFEAASVAKDINGPDGPTMMPCEQCGKMMPVDEMEMVNGKMMCEDCQEEADAQMVGKASFEDGPWNSPESNLSADEFCSVALLDMNPAGKPKVKAMCHLPIRSRPGAPVNRAALQNAKARLNQVKGVSAEDKMKAMKRINSMMESAGMMVGKAIGDDVRKDDNSSAMVAWFVPANIAKKLALPGGELPQDLHVTLAYLGDAASMESYKTGFISALSAFAKTQQPLNGMTGGMIQFSPMSEMDPIPYCAQVDVPKLEVLRTKLVEVLDSVIGIKDVADPTHGFTPHITLIYLPAEAEISMNVPSVPLVVDALTLAWGDERIAFPLSGKDVMKSVEVDVLKVGSDEERTTTAVVYPAMPKEWNDTQGDWCSPETITKMQRQYMIDSQRYDLQHQKDVAVGKAYMVESWIAPIDFDWPLPDGTIKHINKGSWIATTYYPDDELWGLAKDGKIGAYSIRGRGKRRPIS